MKETTKLTFDEKDLKKLIAEKYNLDEHTLTLRINHFKGDAREPEYTSIVAEGIKK